MTENLSMQDAGAGCRRGLGLKLNHKILTNNKYLVIKEQQEFFTLLLLLLFFFYGEGFFTFNIYFVFDPINALFSMRFELDTVNQPCPWQ